MIEQDRYWEPFAVLMSLYANQHGERDDKGKRIGTMYEPADFMPRTPKQKPSSGMPSFESLAASFLNQGAHHLVTPKVKH